MVAPDLTTEEAERRELALVRAETLSPQSMESIRELDAIRTWRWDQMLTTGVSVLAAKKGHWKSLLALQLAYAVAAGRPFLNRAVARANVLYAALELDSIAMSERAKRCGPAPSGLDVLFSFRRGDGALVDLEALVLSRGYGLVILDMLPALLPAGFDGNAYEQVTHFMLALRRLAQRYSLSILALTHSPKSSRDDFADAVIGSVGFAGQADSIIFLERKRGDNTAKLFSTGNHGRDQSMKIALDPETLVLTVTDEGASFLSTEREAVQAVLRKHPDGISTTDVSGIVGKTFDATRKILARMVDEGQAQRIRPGVFTLPDDSNVLPFDRGTPCDSPRTLL